VTVRNRDTMQQERMPMEKVSAVISEALTRARIKA
jgi:glycyl-tRNA synthetase (class II)